jgi:hypothetical protein
VDVVAAGTARRAEAPFGTGKDECDGACERANVAMTARAATMVAMREKFRMVILEVFEYLNSRLMSRQK